MITIYGLTDEHGQIKYVGQTVNPQERFHGHRATQNNFKLTGMAVLERVTTRTKANSSEYKWIEFFGLENLNNRSDRGCISPHLTTFISFKMRFGYEQDAWLQQQADSQGHGNKALVLRLLIDRAMQRSERKKRAA